MAETVIILCQSESRMTVFQVEQNILLLQFLLFNMMALQPNQYTLPTETFLERFISIITSSFFL